MGFMIMIRIPDSDEWASKMILDASCSMLDDSWAQGSWPQPVHGQVALDPGVPGFPGSMGGPLGPGPAPPGHGKARPWPWP